MQSRFGLLLSRLDRLTGSDFTIFYAHGACRALRRAI